jgi:outer membrane protein OmpA-like peptidoglycan-associated protein
VSIYADVAYMYATEDLIPYYGKKNKAWRANNIASIDLGITYNIGKTGWSKAVSLEDYEALSAEACAKLAALRAQLKAEQDENARLRAELAKWANHKCPEASSNVTTGATSVFFDLNSAKINSKKDLINLEAVAAAAKNAKATVVVRGSADSKTGSSAYNQKLSEARAQAVADELVNLGVNRSNITVQGVGGVDEVAPFNLNRRAIVTLK